MHSRAFVNRTVATPTGVRSTGRVFSAPMASALHAATVRGPSSRVTFGLRSKSVNNALTLRRAPLSPAPSNRARLLVTEAKGKAGDKPDGAQQHQKRQKPKKKKEDNIYGHTVLLPTTAFEMRANSTVKEPAMQQWWAEEGIYEEIAGRAGDDEANVFTLHDGPPYANGDLHIGHALNKILKDFINRYQSLLGKKVEYVPGWDCHGLPIELKVLQSMDADRRLELTPIKLRKKAKAFAMKTVEKQREQFKRYGVWASWEGAFRNPARLVLHASCSTLSGF